MIEIAGELMNLKDLIPFIVFGLAILSTIHFIFFLKKQSLEELVLVLGLWWLVLFDFSVMIKEFTKNRFFKKLDKAVWWMEE